MTDPYAPLTLSQAREDADLSVGQAAILSGLSTQRLRTVETHPEELTAQEWLILATLYGVVRFATPRPEGDARRVRYCHNCGALWLEGDAPLCAHTRSESLVTHAGTARAHRFLYAYAPFILTQTRCGVTIVGHGEERP